MGERGEFKNPVYVTGNFGRLCRRNGIVGSEDRYLTMRGLRDTLTTVVVQGKSIDIKSLSALLGYSNVAMTLNKYVGYGDEEMRRAGMREIGKAMRRRMAG